MIRLVRAELFKFFSTRLWWGLLIGVALSAAAYVGLTAGVAGSSAQGRPTPGVHDPAVVRGIYTAGLSVSYLFALAIGIIAMAGEFRHQTMTSTALAVPRRSRIVTAKLAALSLIGAGFGVVTVLVGLAVGIPIIAARHGATRLTTDDVPRTLLLAVLAVALWTVLGLGIGTLIRNQIVALLVAIGVAWIAEPLVSIGLQAAHWGSVARFLPTTATSALVTPPTRTGGLTITYLPWWGGALTLLGYAVISGGLGAALTLRRDIT